MSDTKLIQKVLDRVSTLDQKIDNGFKSVNSRTDKLDEKLTARIDKLGLQLASLEDDSPTIEEFDKLTNRVTNLEKHTSPTQ